MLFEQSSSHLGNFQEKINSFMRSISDLDNFSFGTYLAGYVLQRLLVHDVLIMFLVYF